MNLGIITGSVTGITVPQLYFENKLKAALTKANEKYNQLIKDGYFINIINIQYDINYKTDLITCIITYRDF